MLTQSNRTQRQSFKARAAFNIKVPSIVKSALTGISLGFVAEEMTKAVEYFHQIDVLDYLYQLDRDELASLFNDIKEHLNVALESIHNNEFIDYLNLDFNFLGYASFTIFAFDYILRNASKNNKSIISLCADAGSKVMGIFSRSPKHKTNEFQVIIESTASSMKPHSD